MPNLHSFWSGDVGSVVAAAAAVALCVMISSATRKGNKWRQTRIDNSAAFATYSSVLTEKDLHVHFQLLRLLLLFKMMIDF